MDRYSDSFNEHADVLREMREAADRDDLNFAMSDVEVGRQRKHLPDTDIDPRTGKKRNRHQEAIQRTLDWLLLNDPQYRLAHKNLISTVREAQHDTQTALERVVDELRDARRAMDDLLGNAAKLPDGTRVFKDKHGSVRNEDGEIIPPEFAATVEWRGDEPSYETYEAQRSRIEELESAEKELRGIENELGDIHERNTRNDDPLTIDEKRQDIDRANELGERAKEIDSKLSAPKRQEFDPTKREMDSVTSQSIEMPQTNFGKSS